MGAIGINKKIHLPEHSLAISKKKMTVFNPTETFPPGVKHNNQPPENPKL